MDQQRGARSGEPRTLFEKLWQRHVVDETQDGETLLYIDRHLVYEVTSPQAFEGLRLASRQPWRRETVLAAVTDLVGGQVQLSVQSLPSSISFIKSGK